jgi:hypothetical protein
MTEDLSPKQRSNLAKCQLLRGMVDASDVRKMESVITACEHASQFEYAFTCVIVVHIHEAQGVEQAHSSAVAVVGVVDAQLVGRQAEAPDMSVVLRKVPPSQLPPLHLLSLSSNGCMCSYASSGVSA